MLASVDFPSQIRVSSYGVDVDSLDRLLENQPPVEKDNLVLVDEIGQMQLYSLRFKEKISDYLDQSSIYAGTISSVYEDDFTRKELARDEVVLLQATTENREDMKEILSCLAKNFPLLDKLPSEVSAKFFGMACEYARTQSHVQLRKLFNNALVYVAEDKVFTKGNGNYKVQGNTREHVVYHNEKKGMACDCDLFTGQGAYKNQPAECSHIQAVQLVKGK